MSVSGYIIRLYSLLLLYQFIFHIQVQCNEEKCEYKLKELWSASLRNSPLVATPTFFDVDGDGYGDIVAPSFSGEVWSIHGESGHIVDNWPFYLEEKAFHATPLVYDINRDGILEFLLTTSDAEILFLHTNNSLLHGETIKIPPLKVRRHWYKLDKMYVDKLAEELNKQLGDSERLKQGPDDRDIDKRSTGGSPPGHHQHTEAFSEFESRYGQHANPLYSRHQVKNFISGVDSGDQEIVFVDAHVLATPTLADTNGDGLINELVIPVSYYFDPFFYGDPHNMMKLGGLEQEELQHYVAGGVVIIDLIKGAVIRQKLLGLTEASDSQPSYILSTPTVVRMFPGVGGAVIIIAMATGDLNMMDASTLEMEPGFPVRLDSVSAQVAVADLYKNGVLELVVGDNSGNIYCIDSHGNRKWEFETREAIQSNVRFADYDSDGILDVIFITTYGSLWVLHGNYGTPFPGFPIRLNLHIQSAPLLLHLSHTHTNKEDTLTAIVPAISEIYVIDLKSQCMTTIHTENIIFTIQSGDIDPYNPGLEILAVGFEGNAICFAPEHLEIDPQSILIESWSENSLGHTRFIHSTNTISIYLPELHQRTLNIRGNSFYLDVIITDNGGRRSKELSVSVAVGNKYLLYNGTLPLYQQVTTHTLTVTTPTEPMAAFLTVTFCNEYLQCEAISHHVQFNLHFHTSLQWFLSAPFLVLCASLLWLLRDANFEPLPGVVFNRKSL